MCVFLFPKTATLVSPCSGAQQQSLHLWTRPCPPRAHAMPLKCSIALWTRLLADTNMNIHVETRFKTENACRRDRTGGVRRPVKEEETRGGHEFYVQRQKYAGQPGTWKDALFLRSPTRTSLIDNLVSMAFIKFTLLVLFVPPSPASKKESPVFHYLKYRIAFE